MSSAAARPRPRRDVPAFAPALPLQNDLSSSTKSFPLAVSLPWVSMRSAARTGIIWAEPSPVCSARTWLAPILTREEKQTRQRFFWVKSLPNSRESHFFFNKQNLLHEAVGVLLLQMLYVNQNALKLLQKQATISQNKHLCVSVPG